MKRTFVYPVMLAVEVSGDGDARAVSGNEVLLSSLNQPVDVWGPIPGSRCDLRDAEVRADAEVAARWLESKR